MNSIPHRLRAANPVPDPGTALSADRHADLSAEIAQRTSGPSPQPRSERNTGRDRVVFAAASVLLAAMMVGVIMTRSPATTDAAGSAEVKLAERYIAARNNWDSEAMLALLSPSAAVSEFPIVRGSGELPAAADYLALVEETMSVTACDRQLHEPGSVVCQYEISNALIRQVGAPATPGILSFVIDGDLIISVDNVVDFDPYTDPATTAWLEWLDRNTQLGMDDLYRWALHSDEVVTTPRLDKLDQFAVRLALYTDSGP